jgi:hypothetical protein
VLLPITDNLCQQLEESSPYQPETPSQLREYHSVVTASLIEQFETRAVTPGLLPLSENAGGASSIRPPRPTVHAQAAPRQREATSDGTEDMSAD